MRAKLIVGNWKMNGSHAALAELDGIAFAADAAPQVDVAICPPATLIAAAATRAPFLTIGAQDCHEATSGAHTGCLSAGLLIEAGARAVILGHSERRRDQQETSTLVKAKATAAMAAGLTAIVCVGETEVQRDAGAAIAVVRAKLDGSVPPTATAASLVIGYEPLWAIGTGRIPTLAEVAEVHAAIRARLILLLGAEGARVRILYGGSMNAGNAADLLAIPDVDGGLVGGASLTAAQFAPIIAAAAAVG